MILSPEPTIIHDLEEILKLTKSLKGASIYRGENGIFPTLMPKVGRNLPRDIATLTDSLTINDLSRVIAGDEPPLEEEALKQKVHNASESFKNYERHILEHFRMQMKRFVSDPIYDIDFVSAPRMHRGNELQDYKKIAVFGQHNGLPTRLLDWTWNVLVALYFALEGGKPDTTRRLWILDTDRGYTTDEFIFAKSFNIISPMHLHQRIATQASVFTTQPYPFIDLREYIGYRHGLLENERLIECRIRPAFHERILNEIQLLGISHGQIWVDLKGVARDITDANERIR